MAQGEKTACVSCQGSGKCPKCNGAGNIVQNLPNPIAVISGQVHGATLSSRTCNRCSGSGTCQACKGTGKSS